MLPDETLQLLVQPLSELPRIGGKEELIGYRHVEHLIHPVLQAPGIILQRQIQNRSLSHREFPQRGPRAYMVGKLRDEKAFPEFRSACQQIRPRIEQAIDQRRLGLICRFIQFPHGHRRQIRGIVHLLKKSVEFFERI